MGAAVPTSLGRVAGRASFVSGVLAAVGVVFLLAMFVSFGVGATSPALVFGRVNDTLVLVSYLLAAPGVLAVRELLRPSAPILGGLLAILGLAAISAIVVLQALLVFDVLTFEEQVGPVSIALLVLGGWFVASGYLGRSSGVLPRGVRMGLIAATYVGYPIYAIWLGRHLSASAPLTPPRRAVVPVEE